MKHQGTTLTQSRKDLYIAASCDYQWLFSNVIVRPSQDLVLAVFQPTLPGYQKRRSTWNQWAWGIRYHAQCSRWAKPAPSVVFLVLSDPPQVYEFRQGMYSEVFSALFICLLLVTLAPKKIENLQYLAIENPAQLPRWPIDGLGSIRSGLWGIVCILYKKSRISHSRSCCSIFKREKVSHVFRLNRSK